MDINRTTKKLFSNLFKFGKNSVGPLTLMWLLDFNFVRQATSIAYAHARADWDGVRAVINECMTQIGRLVLATVVFCFLTYWLGGTFFSKSLQAMYFVSLTALIVYSCVIAIAVAFALQIFTEMTAKKKVKKAGDKEDKDPVGEIWKLFRHVLYWDCVFMLLNFLAKPWQEGHFEPFVVLVIA